MIILWSIVSIHFACPLYQVHGPCGRPAAVLCWDSHPVRAARGPHCGRPRLLPQPTHSKAVNQLKIVPPYINQCTAGMAQ